jgi:hypothetical protein
MQGRCQASGVVYLATLRADLEEFNHIRMTERTFKKRFYEHTATFNHQDNSLRYKHRQTDVPIKEGVGIERPGPKLHPQLEDLETRTCI